MNPKLIRLFASMCLLIACGCEVPAASGTVEVTIESLSQRDIDDQGRVIYAVASVNEGACAEGPCSPNPCGDDAQALAQGRTKCIGQGDQHQCICPPGQYQDMMAGAGQCVAETSCVPGNRACGNLPGNFPDRGVGNAACAEGNIICDCNPGYTGTFCGECDIDAGYFSDGLGFCSLPDANEAPCRDGQGNEAFAQLLADAEEKLGRAPVELELAGARMEIVPGSEQGVRSWAYLFSGDVTLFVQTVSGFPSNAGVVEVPAEEAGTPPLEFDMNVTRATTSSDPQFRSGDFRVGISAPTNRQLTEMFSTDIKLILDFNAY